MAIPLLPILKAIAPLLVASSGIAGSLNERVGQGTNLATDERVRKLEQDLLKMSQVLAGSVEQLEAAAKELRTQVELNEARESRLRQVTMISAAAAILSVISLIVSLAM